jgi:hypothetical protein
MTDKSAPLFYGWHVLAASFLVMFIIFSKYNQINKIRATNYPASYFSTPLVSNVDEL